jgi:hypothetical protein
MPLSQIVSVKIIKKLFWQKVEVEFRSRDGGNEGVSLWLKKPEDFVAALGFPDGQCGQQFMKSNGVITANPIEPGA